MGTTIMITAISLLLIVAAYIIARLDDKLIKAKSEIKALTQELDLAKNEKELEHENYEREKLYLQKANHKLQALQVDYDRLLTDYHILEQENAK